MKLDILRQQLINGTIQVIAEEGLDKATTKQIGTKTGINEAYIYRCFKCKEDMFAKTFESLDLELIAALKQYGPILYKSDLTHEEKHREYFTCIWDFLITNREKCITYIRYYYSPYFLKYSSEEHHARFAPVIANFAKLFKEDANVRLIMNHMLNVALDFAVKVFNNEMPDEDEFTEHVFLAIYRSIQPYFKEEDLI